MYKLRRRGRGRGVIVAVVALLGLVGAACTPGAPPSIPFGGGTFPIDVTIPSQSFTFNFVLCTATFATEPVVLSGASVTIPPVTVDPTQPTITIPNVTVAI